MAGTQTPQAAGSRIAWNRKVQPCWAKRYRRYKLLPLIICHRLATPKTWFRNVCI